MDLDQAKVTSRDAEGETSFYQHHSTWWNFCGFPGLEIISSIIVMLFDRDFNHWIIAFFLDSDSDIGFLGDFRGFQQYLEQVNSLGDDMTLRSFLVWVSSPVEVFMECFTRFWLSTSNGHELVEVTFFFKDVSLGTKL